MHSVAIVGAGASGLFAALNINLKNSIIFDKNSGAKKLSITGNSRCNITNAINFDSFLEAYGKNGQFLRDAFKIFFRDELIEFLKSQNIETANENDKIILKNIKSKQFAQKLLKIVKNKKNIEFKAYESVLNIKNKDGIFTITTDKGKYTSKTVLLACGGRSYPATGSTGDGYGFAQSLRHTIVKPKPFEVPFCSDNRIVKNLQGISLQDTDIAIKIKNKKVKTKGDIIFTHFGISGPAILKLSEYDFQKTSIYIKFVKCTEDEFIKKMRKYNGKIKNYIRNYLPKRAIDYLIQIDKNTKEISKKELNTLLDTLFRFEMDVKKCSFDRAFITQGGIALKEINPKNMESKIVKNLFFAGEIMDIQGSIGGFNLQAAFSTAFLAASNINNLAL